MFNTGQEQLLYEALCEIAEHLGDSFENPISANLLCLSLGITQEEKGDILMAWHQVLKEHPYEKLTLTLFQRELEMVLPVSRHYDETVIKALVKAFSINLMVELYPFAKTI